MNANKEVKDSIDLWVERQLNKPRIRGVHTKVMPMYPGISDAGAYFQGFGGRNSDIPKQIHTRVLNEMRQMTKPKLP